jgi:hypothetical protein
MARNTQLITQVPAGKETTVQVDLLSGEYQGTGENHRHQKIQGGLARKTRGCDLAFENPVVITINP